MDMKKKKNVRARKQAPVTAPSKKTMNFVHHKSKFELKRVLPLVLALLLVSGVFTKVGILDQLDKKVAAYNELSQQQEMLAAVNAKLVDYPALAKEYGRYSYGWMNETETGMVNRMDILALVETLIFPAATVRDLAVNNNVLTMNIHGLTLEQASSLVKNLESTSLVESASVYTAVAEDARVADIFMSIILTKEAE